MHGMYYIFFFKQKTAYEMRISDWSSDVCSSDLVCTAAGAGNCVKINGVNHAAGLIIFEMDVDGVAHPHAQHRPRNFLVEGPVGVAGAVIQQIGRASCRERVCQYV